MTQIGDQQLLSRAWLIDPGDVQVQAVGQKQAGEREPWNGEFYVSFGEGLSRNWEEARRYGFISAGGGSWYSNSLRMLQEGSRIWVAIPGQGFVGVGRVTGPRQPARDFEVDGRPALEVLQARYHREFADDEERSEYFIPVEWSKTCGRNQAVWEVGMFANQNSVCKPVTPKWRSTVEKLVPLMLGQKTAENESQQTN